MIEIYSNTELMKQAVDLFRAGNKQDAESVLKEIIDRDPSNVDAWYGLALCIDDISQKKYYLEKVITLKPDHPKAKELLKQFFNQSTEQKQETPIGGAQPQQKIVKQAAELDKKITRFSWFAWLSGFSILILFGLVIFLQYSVWKLNTSLSQAEARIASLEGGLEMINTNLRIVDGKLSGVQGDISSIVSVVDGLSMDFNRLVSFTNGLSSDLSRVAAVANNANRYAHSHDVFSDTRLKTNVRPLDDPFPKLFQMQGVYYEWTPTAQQNYGLGSDNEIGLIAQEVAQVFPEVVSQDENGYLKIDYARLVPVLIEAIKAQQIQIQELQKQLKTLGN